MPFSKILFPGFGLGLGALEHVPGAYAICTYGDTRFGYLMPGPREVVDRTGIAAGFRVRKIIWHADTQVALTTNGTDTKIYRQETTWVEKATIVGAVGTDIVSFKAILAIALGNGVAYQFTTGTGAGAWTFTASTKAGNAARANYFLVQSNQLVNPRVTYVRNPNELYFATDLNNTGTVTTSSTIGDNTTDQQYFTSLEEDDNGVLLIGTRHTLYSLDSAGLVIKLTPDYPDPPADAGGQSDRNNYENPVKVNGRVYYPIRGYDIGEWFHGQWNEYLAPRWAGPHIPRLQLPINALASAGGWLIAAIGSANTGTNRAVTLVPGGSQLLQNSYAITSELYAGRYEQTDKGFAFVWHGSLLTCTDMLRYMWWDEDDGYLYLSSGDSELVNSQMRRCYFFTQDPLTTVVGGIVNLTTGAVTLETGIIEADYPFDKMVPLYLKCLTTGLASTVPSLAASYRFVPEHNTTTGYTTLETWTAGQRALSGSRFPRGRSLQVGRLQFVLTGDATGNTYGILRSAELGVESFERARAEVGVL